MSLFRAVVTTIFFGAFCPSEVLAQSANDTNRAFQYEDYLPEADAITFHLRFSKMYHRVQGHCIAPRLSPLEILCPVRMLLKYRVRGPSGPGPFFHHLDGSPLTLSQFRAVFKRALENTGRYSGQYGLHSFHIGAAMAAAQLGLSEGATRRIGRIV